MNAKSRVEMVTPMNEAQDLEFAKSIGGTQALIDAVPTKAGTVLGFPLKLAFHLRGTRDVGRNLLASMRTVLDLADEEQTDELLYRALARASWTVEGLDEMLKAGERLFKHGYLPQQEWPTDVIRDLNLLLEDFEDFQETLALGMSAEFREELEAAKAAASDERS